MITNTIKYEVFDLKTNNWILVNMENLEEGDLIRMIKSDGSLVSDSKGNTNFYVTIRPNVGLEGYK